MAGYHFDLPLGEYVEDLLAEAVAAEEVASAFFPFLSRTQEYSADISAVMSELLGISSAYRDLAKHLDSRAYYTRATLILDDLDLSLETMYFTLKPLEYHFERLGITPDPQTAAFARVWREIQSTLRNGSITFLETLRLFKDFLLGLADQLKGGLPEYDMRPIRDQIYEIQLRQRQDTSLSDAFGNLSFGYTDPPTPTRGNWRPPNPPVGIPEPRQPEPRIPRRRVRRVVRPPRTYPFDEPYYPPAETPDLPPISPVTTSSSNSSETRPHWASAVFDGRYPVTPFSTNGVPSRCVGKHMEDAKHVLSRNNQKLLELEMEDGAFTVHLYWNPRDYRATILCMSSNYRRDFTLEKIQSYFPLSRLGVSRQESSLQLYYMSQSRSVATLWARLRFRCYERMVLFFCIVMALKTQGPPEVAMKPSDYRLAGEAVLSEYKIRDDDYLHTLRILKDRDSGGVRLEAAVSSGELKDTPVWTAFITNYIGSRSRITRTTTRAVQIQDLHPYIFSNEYNPPVRRHGHFELSFLKSEDAGGFMESFRSLRPRQQ